MNNSHTFSTTSWDSFDHDRVSNFFCLFIEKLRILIGIVISRNDGNVGIGHYFLGFAFASHRCDSWGWRADEFYIVFLTFFRESSIFRQKSKAWMKSLTIRIFSDLQDFLGVKIAFNYNINAVTGWICSHSIGLVCHCDKFGESVNIRMDCYTLYAHSGLIKIYRFAVFMMRQAIYPLFATRILRTKLINNNNR